jgi:amino acid permease
MMCTIMSMGELAVMYPVNGAYYEYSVRFLDPSWLVTTLLVTLSPIRTLADEMT